MAGLPLGFMGGPIGDGPNPSYFSRRNHRASANVERDIYPHPVPRLEVSDYVKEAAPRHWLSPQHNWQNAGSPRSEPRILYANPWQPGLKQSPVGYTNGATGTTKFFAQCWKFDREIAGKGVWEKFNAPIAPDGFNLFLVVSGVTWWYSQENRCSTSLIARAEGIINDASHEQFIMERAGKLVADVKTWLEGG